MYVYFKNKLLWVVCLVYHSLPSNHPSWVHAKVPFFGCLRDKRPLLCKHPHNFFAVQMVSAQGKSSEISRDLNDRIDEVNNKELDGDIHCKRS